MNTVAPAPADDGRTRSWILVGGSVAVALLLVGIYLAAGGASYTPEKTKDPCKPRAWSDPENLSDFANQFSVSALDGAACQLGVSREALAQALATPEAREQFLERYDVSDAELARAIRASLLRTVDDAERAGALSPLLADPLRSVLKQIPLDQAIELLNDADNLLESVQEFLGPAGELLEQFLP